MLGDTRSAILELESTAPCEIRANKLLFCYKEKNMISYSFNSKNYCGSITKLTSVSKSEAELLLAKKLSLYSTKPHVSGNRHTFFFSDSHMISYSIVNQEEFGVFFEETEINTDILKR